MIDQGFGCTVLIHEATLEEDMLVEAREKRHSTTKQALQVATHMHAQTTVLTHFSQRYPKIPPDAINSNMHTETANKVDTTLTATTTTTSTELRPPPTMIGIRSDVHSLQPVEMATTSDAELCLVVSTYCSCRS